MSILVRIGSKQFCTAVFWRDVISEIFVSAFLLIFLTFNQVHYFSWWRATPTHVGLVMGLTVFVLVESFGHIGGAHMNPGFTLIMFCRGDICLLKGTIFFFNFHNYKSSNAACIAGLCRCRESPNRCSSVVHFHRPLGPQDQICREARENSEKLGEVE